MLDLQPKQRSRKTKVVFIVVAVILCIALAAISNLLFDFALNPNAQFSISMMPAADGGEAEQPAEKEISEATKLWLEYSAQAGDWYQSEGAEAELITHDGLTVRGDSFAQPNSRRYAIVCHGYGGAPEQMAGYARMFYDMGCSVLVPAARAHGDSDGEYYGMGWLERKDMLGWIDQIIAADSEAEIVLFGVSMGGATVMMTAGEELPVQVKCVIEDCGYTSVWDEFSLQLHNLFGAPDFPLLYTSSLVCELRAGYSFEEASAVKQLKQAEVPMLFIHGEEDTFVPYSMLDEVYNACASEEKQKLPVPGAAHGEAAGADPELYWDTVEKFLETYLK